MKEDMPTGDDGEFDRRRAAWERQLLFPHMEAELDWLRAMQDATVDAGLTQTEIRKGCVWFNLGSTRVGTQLSHQMTAAAMKTAERKVSARLS